MATERPQTWTERKLALTAAWSGRYRVWLWTDDHVLLDCVVFAMGNGMVTVSKSLTPGSYRWTLREEEIVGIEPVEAVKPRRKS